jgi:putative FmdB family regulatory protein
MPLYEYSCESCGARFERIQKFSDPPVATCPTCGGPVRKLLSSPAIQFKGTGWYVTDYARSGQPAAGSKGAKGSEAEGSKDTGTKDAKEPAASGGSSADKPASGTAGAKTPGSSGSGAA